MSTGRVKERLEDFFVIQRDEETVIRAVYLSPGVQGEAFVAAGYAKRGVAEHAAHPAQWLAFAPEAFRPLLEIRIDLPELRHHRGADVFADIPNIRRITYLTDTQVIPFP
tara:strand:- start:14 stop:343 length:330 start_codon:yes stop_codon:yes gene_type:complete